MNSVPAVNTASRHPASPEKQDEQLRALARDLEASFLAEMLRSAGLGKARDAFGGGAGEDQFSSFLVREFATSMANAGGIGLQESIYRSLKTHEEPGT